jgi:hypothetical protein
MNRIKQILRALLMAYVALGVVIGGCYAIGQLAKRALPPVRFQVQQRTQPNP